MATTVNHTRDHILISAQALLRETGSAGLRVADLARRAHVGVPTIYYHFASREQVIAQARLRVYREMSRPMATYLEEMSAALDRGDPEAFRAGLVGDVATAWEAGVLDAEAGVMSLLLDIWADGATRQEFRALVGQRFERWVEMIERAQHRGWVAPGSHVATGVAVFWAASVGAAVVPEASDWGVTATSVAELCGHLLGVTSRGAPPYSSAAAAAGDRDATAPHPAPAT